MPCNRMGEVLTTIGWQRGSRCVFPPPPPHPRPLFHRPKRRRQQQMHRLLQQTPFRLDRFQGKRHRCCHDQRFFATGTSFDNVLDEFGSPSVCRREVGQVHLMRPVVVAVAAGVEVRKRKQRKWRWKSSQIRTTGFGLGSRVIWMIKPTTTGATRFSWQKGCKLCTYCVGSGTL